MNYKVLLNVSASALPTLLAVIEGTKGITLDSITTAPASEAPAAPKTQRYIGGKRFKGISANDLILKIIDEHGKASLEQLRKGLEAQGFSPTSASPALSGLITEGVLIKRTDGFFIRQPKALAVK